MNRPKQAGPEFVLRLVSLPDQVPETRRLKQVLRVLRAYRFRCVGIEQAEGEERQAQGRDREQQ
jgi:hypothetical protein